MHLSDTLPIIAMRLDDEPASKEQSLEQSRELERFLASVDKEPRLDDARMKERGA